MAKMIANKYYNKDGTEKVNSYFISISREQGEQSGLVGKDLLVYIKDGKIIVEENKDGKR